MFLSLVPIYMPKIKVRFSSISEIMMIKEHLNLNGREQFLSLTWELDFSQACSFRRMLMNHKYLDFTKNLALPNTTICAKEKTSNHKLNQWLKTYKINFID